MGVLKAPKIEGLEEYLERVELHRDRGYNETAFSIPIADYDKVKDGLVALGLRVTNLDPIFVSWSRNTVPKFQRVLVQWEEINNGKRIPIHS